jgi:hypothetical protein
VSTWQSRLAKSHPTHSQYRIFYQNNPERISACPVTIHSLLHIADGIEAAGPVWVYWSFVMERYCGFLKRDGVRSRRKPYASLSNRVRHIAQLNTTKIRYNLVDLLSLEGPATKCGDVFPERVFWHLSISTTCTNFTLKIPSEYSCGHGRCWCWTRTFAQCL